MTFPDFTEGKVMGNAPFLEPTLIGFPLSSIMGKNGKGNAKRLLFGNFPEKAPLFSHNGKGNWANIAFYFPLFFPSFSHNGKRDIFGCLGKEGFSLILSHKEVKMEIEWHCWGYVMRLAHHGKGF